MDQPMPDQTAQEPAPGPTPAPAAPAAAAAPIGPSVVEGPTRWTEPVFILGCPRSGTTLLTLMLSSHPRLAIPPESRFLVPIWRQRLRFGDLRDDDNRARLAAEIVARKGRKFNHLRVDREQVRQAIIEGDPTIGSALGEVYRTYARKHGKPRWGDKQPTYFRNIDMLRTMWPEAQFIHLVRDGRDCVASLKRMSWFTRGHIAATAIWVHSIDCGTRAARRLPDRSFVEVRYEDLVQDYPTVLRGLCDFLGEEFSEDMLRPQKLAKQLPRRQRNKWHWRTATYIGPRRVGTYGELLSDRERALVERVAGSRLRAYGYDVPEQVGHVPVTDLARYRLAITSLRVRTWVLATADRLSAKVRAPVVDRG
jgi:hypothetical protein